MTVETKPLTEVTQDALRLLYRELGLVNTVRFLNQFTAGLGNYTEERQKRIENVTLDEALAELQAFESQQASGE